MQATCDEKICTTSPWWDQLLQINYSHHALMSVEQYQALWMMPVNKGIGPAEKEGFLQNLLQRGKAAFITEAAGTLPSSKRRGGD